MVAQIDTALCICPHYVDAVNVDSNDWGRIVQVLHGATVYSLFTVSVDLSNNQMTCHLNWKVLEV